MSTTLQDIRQDLSYLLGETSIPATGTSNRDQFINRVIQDIYIMDEWAFADTLATLPVTSTGLVSMPSNSREEGLLFVQQPVGTNVPIRNVFSQVTYPDFGNYTSTDYVYYLSGDGENGQYLNLNQTLVSFVAVQYTLKAPVLSNSTDVVPIPSSMTVAKGALVYYRQQEDPQADTSIEKSRFDEAVLQLMQLKNRNRPVRRALGIQEATGFRTGTQ